MDGPPKNESDLLLWAAGHITEQAAFWKAQRQFNDKLEVALQSYKEEVEEFKKDMTKEMWKLVFKFFMVLGPLMALAGGVGAYFGG